MDWPSEQLAAFQEPAKCFEVVLLPGRPLGARDRDLPMSAIWPERPALGRPCVGWPAFGHLALLFSLGAL